MTDNTKRLTGTKATTKTIPTTLMVLNLKAINERERDPSICSNGLESWLGSEIGEGGFLLSGQWGTESGIKKWTKDKIEFKFFNNRNKGIFQGHKVRTIKGRTSSGGPVIK